ncbi:unnamed protein product [Amoebophrya sp. A25]|nr:unnamed protein product [Amoebophrya sp. A25]|eukprot:GSA25T00013440001.1
MKPSVQKLGQGFAVLSTSEVEALHVGIERYLSKSGVPPKPSSGGLFAHDIMSEIFQRSHMTEVRQGYLRMELPNGFPSACDNGLGVVHGGCVATIFDVLTSFAIYTAMMNNPVMSVSVALNCSYPRGLLLGLPAVMEAWTEKAHGNVFFSKARAVVNEEVCCTCEHIKGVLRKMPNKDRQSQQSSPPADASGTKTTNSAASKIAASSLKTAPLPWSSSAAGLNRGEGVRQASSCSLLEGQEQKTISTSRAVRLERLDAGLEDPGIAEHRSPIARRSAEVNKQSRL